MNKRDILFLICYGVLEYSAVEGQTTHTSMIETESGRIRGIISTSIENMKYAAFKGIPYAEPPIGYLRFKPPVKKRPWTGVLNATLEGSTCTQYSDVEARAIGSEDCLHLNIFTPHITFNSSISKPVLVWIYGGAFTTGHSTTFHYGPDFILKEDVLLVTFNYRVSALGFLNLNIDNATGNCGLKDQNLALKWVKQNIANFGGNPDKITIFGQSAGAVSVDLQVLSDMSVGLFSQSISMSGSTLCLYWGFQGSVEAVQQAFLLGSKLGINTLSKETLLRHLYNISAADIVTAAKKLAFIPFRPSVEDPTIATDQEKFLTECTLAKYLSGNYSKGPHMMGFTSDETVSLAGSEFVSIHGKKPRTIQVAKMLGHCRYTSPTIGIGKVFKATRVSTDPTLSLPVLSLVLFFPSMDDVLDATNKALYSLQNGSLISEIPILSSLNTAVTNRASNLTEAVIYQITKDASDLLFVTGIDTKQKLMQKNNGFPIYYYRFSYDNKHSAHRADGINLDGAGHCDDLPYLFYIPSAKLPLNDSGVKITRKRMVKMWTNFVKYGNPTPENKDNDLLNITWPDSRSQGKHVEIGAELTVASRPTSTTIKLLQSSGLGASPLMNDCANNLLSTLVDSVVSIIGMIG